MVGSANSTFQLNMKEKYLCVHLKKIKQIINFSVITDSIIRNL